MMYVCAAERADIADGGDYQTKHALDVQDAAEEFARWAWDNMDGWEWLRDDGEVFVFSERDGLHRVQVRVDFEPVFFCEDPVEVPPEPAADASLPF